MALWREALLAQAVLRGKTKGYKHHPQLLRFRAHASPVGCIGEYLRNVHAEAEARGYSFSAKRITPARALVGLTVTRGQLELEWRHLLKKLRIRDPERFAQLRDVKRPQPHPLFRVVRGSVAHWERAAAPSREPRQRTRRRAGHAARMAGEPGL